MGAHTKLLIFISATLLLVSAISSSSSTTQVIERGFSATPNSDDPSSTSFQPLLSDPTGIFAFGFFPGDSGELDLAVVHLSSYFPVWRAALWRPARWSSSITLSFNGTLILFDQLAPGPLWLASSDEGDRLVLLNSSNLQVQKLGQPSSVIWQSFNYPSDTLVTGQNFTSDRALLSRDQHFSMKLRYNYFSLFMEFGASVPPAMYWKHTALEARAQIMQDAGPIYARVEEEGFLGMYQQEHAPVEVLSFNSFNRNITALRRLTLETDGNLKAYFWNSTSSAWEKDYVAITEPCGLPTVCGAYGLCSAEAQPMCSCLDGSGVGDCFPAGSGNLCGVDKEEVQVVRRNGVELANKELLGFTKMNSSEECEAACARNCTCWGTIYSSSSGSCYRIDYPVQTLVQVGDESKLGYFKVKGWKEEGKKRDGRRRSFGLALLVVGTVGFGAAVLYGTYSVLERRRRRRRGGVGVEEGLAPGSYKDLKSVSSFRSTNVELSNSFRK